MRMPARGLKAWKDRGLNKLLKPGKFANEKTEIAGYSFASKGEAALFSQLKLEERAGHIKDIQVQSHVYLTEARIDYVADFKIFDIKLNQIVYIEFKGFETPVWRIKRRLYQHYGPGRLRVYKQIGNRIAMTEEIIPKGLK